MTKQISKLGILLFVSMLALSPYRVKAQTVGSDTNRIDLRSSSVYSDDEEFVKDMGLWVRSHFLDNWYLQGQVGGQLYGGYDDYLGPLADHLGYSVELKVGRWVFPKLGYRFGIGYGTLHGFLDRNTYNNYRGTIIDHGGYGISDPAYNGYYFDYNSDLLIQNWKYGCLTADIMMKLITVKGYNRNQKFVPMLYVGAGYHKSFSNRSNEDAESKNRYQFGAEIHGGVVLNYRFNDRWNVYADARASMLTGTFDREWVGGIETATLNEDFPIYAHVGAEYHFNLRTEMQRSKWQSVSQYELEHNVVDSNVHQMEIKTFSYTFNTISLVDTIYTYDSIAEFSPEYDEALMRRARKYVQDQIDSMRRHFDRDCQDAGLDDILGKHLLPYEMVFFELDKWDILSEEDIKIRKMAAVMRAYPDYQFLLIGSADSKTGTVKRNDFLSVNRSDVVYNQLVTLYGINPDQLKRVYMGGILDFEPFELNRATVIIMDHPRIMEEFNKLKFRKQAGGSKVEFND